MEGRPLPSGTDGSGGSLPTRRPARKRDRRDRHREAVRLRKPGSDVSEADGAARTVEVGGAADVAKSGRRVLQDAVFGDDFLKHLVCEVANPVQILERRVNPVHFTLYVLFVHAVPDPELVAVHLHEAPETCL